MKKLSYLIMNLSSYLFGKQNALSSGHKTDIVDVVNDLTFDILRGHLKDYTEKNLIFSPLSVLLMVSIMNYGFGYPNAKARADLLGNLNLNDYRHKLHNLTGSLLKNLTQSINQVPDTHLDVLTVLQFADYLQLSNRVEDELMANYNAIVKRYDFERADERNRALNETYRLIRKHTRNQLNLFGLQYLPKEASRLNVYSTIHLNSNWLDAFNPLHTFTDKFFNQNGKMSKILFMSRNTYVNTSSLVNRDLQLVELPLEDNQLSLIMIVPGQRYVLHEMLFNSKNDEIKKAIKNLSQKYINIRIPRFTVEQQTSVQELLKPLKINLAFDCKQCSLQRFSKRNRTCLDFNLLYTRLSVDEQGLNTVNSQTGFYGEKRIDSAVPKLFVQSPFAFIVRDRITGNQLPN